MSGKTATIDEHISEVMALTGCKSEPELFLLMGVKSRNMNENKFFSKLLLLKFYSIELLKVIQLEKNSQQFIEELVERYLTEGASVNSRNTVSGQTALILAAKSRQNKAAKLLIASGAIIDDRDFSGATPLQAAAEAGNHVGVKILLASGAAVNAQDAFGLAPLHCAIDSGNAEAVKALLKYGAEVNIRSKRDETPLKKAINAKREKIADMLRKHGAKE